MARKQKKKTVAVKKKQWVKVLAPDGKEIGESHIEDPKNLVGRKIKVNLMSYFGNPKNRKFNVKFLVTECDGVNAKTRMCAFETQPTALKMIVKKGSDRIDHRFVVKTKNGESIILKPIITSRKNIPALLKSNIRKLFGDLIKKEISKLTTDQAFNDIIFQKIQKGMKKDLSKLYPVKGISIKKMELVISKADGSDKKVKIEEKEPVKEDNEDN